MTHPFLVMEAIHSTAIEHGNCTCLTCRAAHGDSVALKQILTYLAEKGH